MSPPGRGQRGQIESEAQLRRLGQMLVDLNEAERLLTRIQREAVALGEDDLVQLLDGELFWKLRAVGDELRQHFDLERVHGGHM